MSIELNLDKLRELDYDLSNFRTRRALLVHELESMSESIGRLLEVRGNIINDINGRQS